MAKATFTKSPVPEPDDVWDRISGAELKLNREELKIVFTLLGQIVLHESGRAGLHADRLYNKIADTVGHKAADHNNLIIRQSLGVDPFCPSDLTYRIVDVNTGEVA